MTERVRWAYTLMAFLTGAIMALQARINSLVSTEIGDSFAAGAFVFTIGGVTVGLFMLVRKRTRASVRKTWQMVRAKELPWYLLLGGCGGVMGIFAQTGAVQIVGVALFSMAYVVGQMVASSAIDHFSWFAGEQRRMSLAGLGAILIAIAGVAIASTPGADSLGAVAWGALVFVFVAGWLVATHMVFNGRITELVKHPGPSVTATYISGVAALALVSLGLLLTRAGHLDKLLVVRPWYAFLGIIGPVVVLAAAIVVRRLGALLFTLGMVAGQLAGAALLDVYWPATDGAHITWGTLIGILVTFVGLAIHMRWGSARPKPE